MRHDHTSWLIHFVRDRDPDQDFLGETEDEYNLSVGGELGPDASAFEVLLSIIKIGGLIPGYSLRNGRTTIYGGDPVICATEMPLYSFANYVKEVNNTKKVSAYGIAFLKSEFYNASGRPVIYGLASNNEFKYSGELTAYRKILEESVLPKSEQYRYVAYNPSFGNSWTAERRTAERRTAERRTAERRTAERRTAERRKEEMRIAEKRTEKSKTEKRKSAERITTERRTAERRTGERTAKRRTAERRTDRKSTRLNSSHSAKSRMPSSA